MTGTLDPECKGLIRAPTNEIHVKTRLNWMPELKDTNKIDGFAEWPQGWQ